MSVQHGSAAWKNRLTIPTYRIGEAACYARISPQTVSAWHKSRGKDARSTLSEKEPNRALSFLQLIEMAVVADMRRAGVKLKEIREAREDMIRETGLAYPFAQLKFKTDGADIFREVEGPLGDVLTDRLLAHNHGGQYFWTAFIQRKLEAINYDDDGTAISWKVAGSDKEVEINPKLSFGAPQVGGVKTSLIKTRFAIGEEVDEIASDYGLEEGQVIEALLFERIFPEDRRLSRWIN
ncbi:hypothetical protein MALG_03290 [Marinovum algicola DG 898]|nr:hypothetical protein MALG_03290 [Marinovum algicola DG 898]